MELKEVFEPVLNFIKNLQKKDKEMASKQAAKDRLKLVLMQDRASVSPDFFELMKKEIIDVIKKYIEIDEESLEVELTRGMEVGLEGPALYANIPIKNVKPVAPKNGEEEAIIGLSEEKAEEVAEKLLNQAEELLAQVSEKKETEEKENKCEVVETNDEKDKNIVKKEEEAKKTTTKKALKTNSKEKEKSVTKKTTTTKSKKDVKK